MTIDHGVSIVSIRGHVGLMAAVFIEVTICFALGGFTFGIKPAALFLARVRIGLCLRFLTERKFSPADLVNAAARAEMLRNGIVNMPLQVVVERRCYAAVKAAA